MDFIVISHGDALEGGILYLIEGNIKIKKLEMFQNRVKIVIIFSQYTDCNIIMIDTPFFNNEASQSIAFFQNSNVFIQDVIFGSNYLIESKKF